LFAGLDDVRTLAKLGRLRAGAWLADRVELALALMAMAHTRNQNTKKDVQAAKSGTQKNHLPAVW
jgi:hypothetical protein